MAMKLHPRHAPYIQADLDIKNAVIEAVGRHKLTYAELTHILGAILLDWNKYAIRDEREESSEGSLT